MTPHSPPIEDAGRADVAALVAAAMAWRGLSSRALAKNTGRISTVTVRRVRNGERVSEVMLRSLGEILDLPRDFLLYVGRQDLDAMVRAGMASGDLDLVRWTAELMISDHHARPINARDLMPRTREVLKDLGLL